MRRAMAQSALTFASVLMIVALAGCGGGARPVAGLPDDNTLQPGAIPAGESRTVRGPDGVVRVVTCPADGEACSVTPGEDDTGEPTDDAPVVVTPTVVTPTNKMIEQANDGPDGTSAGAHARGLEGNLLVERRLDHRRLNRIFVYDIGEWVERWSGISISSLLSESYPLALSAASWDEGTAPTLGLLVSALSLGDFGDLTVDSDSSISSLGTGWNGVALSQYADETTWRAVVYSNIEKAVGGVADEYYMTLGAWLTYPDDPDDSTKYHWGAFANNGFHEVRQRLSRAEINAFTGTATYEGPATGLYMTSTYSASGELGAPLELAKVGSFTATATINADFGSAGGVGGFGGSVTNFMENGESLGDWTVNLHNTDEALWDGAGGTDTTLFVGRTGGDAAGEGYPSDSLDGNWSVEFSSDGVGAGAGQAVGVFTASTPAANEDALRIVGAFGAERQGRVGSN